MRHLLISGRPAWSWACFDTRACTSVGGTCVKNINLPLNRAVPGSKCTCSPTIWSCTGSSSGAARIAIPKNPWHYPEPLRNKLIKKFDRLYGMFTVDGYISVCVNVQHCVNVKCQEWVQTHSMHLYLRFHWRNVKLWRWRWRKRQVWTYLYWRTWVLTKAYQCNTRYNCLPENSKSPKVQKAFFSPSYLYLI